MLRKKRRVACTAASQPPDDPKPSCIGSNLLPEKLRAKVFTHLVAVLRSVYNH